MKSLYNFLLALYPITSGYGLSPQADFGALILFCIGMICCFKMISSFKFRFPLGYFVFLLVALLLSILFSQTVPLRLIIYSANLCMACFLIDFDALKKYYGWLVFISCFIFVLQVVIAFVTEVHVSGLIPFIPTIYEGMGVDMISFQEQDVRFSSLFLEPSYFVQFLFPYVVLQLFVDKKHSLRNASLVSSIILLVGSGNGAVLLIIIWGVWFFCGNIGLRIKLALVFLGFLGIGLIWNIDNSVFIRLLERTAEFQSYAGDERYQSSGFIRIFRGYFVYADMPFLNKLFGANPQFAESVFRSNIMFAANNDVMINGTQTLLIYYGFVSCFLFFRHLFLMFWSYRHNAMFVMTICSIWLMLSESYFLCARMFLTIMIMYGISISKSISVKTVEKRVVRIINVNETSRHNHHRRV